MKINKEKKRKKKTGVRSCFLPFLCRECSLMPFSFPSLFFSPKKIKEQEAVAIFLKKDKKQDLTPIELDLLLSLYDSKV